jgi:hypothetical protein
LHDCLTPYAITNKTDGIHYLGLFMELFGKYRFFMIDRKLNIYAVPWIRIGKELDQLYDG